MFSKMMKKMQNMTWKDWLVVGLWLLTFAVLLAFVFSASMLEKNNARNDVLAAIGLSFTISIFSALITTVAFKFLERKRGGNND